MADRFEWFPPQGGDSLIFEDIPYVVKDYGNLGNALVVPQMQKAPYQIGESFLNASIQARAFSLRLMLVADTKSELMDLRRELSRSMVIQPVRDESQPDIGVLRWHRDGHDPIDLICMPRESPQFDWIDGTTAAYADLEFVADYPYWQETEDSFRTLEAGGAGLQFALEFPMEIQTFNLTVEIDNEGDVRASILARVFGEVTTFRLINNTTGEQIEVTGSIAAGDYVEVNTAFGAKSVVLVSGGTRTDIFDRLTLGSTFWQLERGVNSVTFEADSNTSGSAVIYWRQRYAGS